MSKDFDISVRHMILGGLFMGTKFALALFAIVLVISVGVIIAMFVSLANWPLLSKKLDMNESKASMASLFVKPYSPSLPLPLPPFFSHPVVMMQETSITDNVNTVESILFIFLCLLLRGIV